MGLDDVHGTPAQVGRHQVAVFGFAHVFQRDDKPLLAVGAHLDPCAAHDHVHRFAAASADGLGGHPDNVRKTPAAPARGGGDGPSGCRAMG